MSRIRAQNFRIYGEPILLVVAIFALVPNLVIAFREQPPDFSLFFASATALRHGIDPYHEALVQHGPNALPPAVLFTLIPLTWLSERVAYWLWIAGSMLALIVSLRAIARALRVRFRPLLIASLGLQGVGVTLRYGQVTLLLLPLMTWAWLSDRENRKTRAGALLGVLVLIKPFVGLYALYMAWRREWQILQWLILATIATFAVGLLAGVAASRSWLETLSAISSRAPHVVNASWLGLVSRVFTVDRPQPNPAYTAWVNAPRLATAVWAIGVSAIAAITFWAVRRTTDRDRQWALVGTAMLLISPLGWTYYFPLLLPPLAAVISDTRHLLLVIVAFVLLVVPSNILAMGSYGALATATLGSPYTWGLLVLWAAICRDRRRSRRT